ncbi:DUF1295 domain-containing protein [Paenibacillus whitsoniae]|uniref:DUF1295 domain-containing protein n=1 Tax=Paenibacillus whitsoniae TaxID=2496558 RepID=A0A3S0A7D1_9BACL|nr:DUF1295 domain-containing protein [Paenibacillus whitsoniae]RTE11380.1 DUF1295 domain-containing protein [Paenibacillus whitsoniae]
MWSLYGVSGIAIGLFMLALFGVAQVKKDNSIVDIGWGIGFVIIALLTFAYLPGYGARRLLVTGLVAAWGLRLALHLWLRSLGRGEDFRYANFRKQWGKRAVVIALFRVFLMQGVIMLGLAYPIILANANPDSSLDAAAYAGLVVWLVGFLFQAVGDYQLRVFKRRRKRSEDVLTSGLWRYTRHPNYFGEAAMWWGIALIVLPLPGGWGALISAFLINLLLLKISGVPFLDRRYAENAAYQQYKKETNRFIPWFPKKQNS